MSLVKRWLEKTSFRVLASARSCSNAPSVLSLPRWLKPGPLLLPIGAALQRNTFGLVASSWAVICRTLMPLYSRTCLPISLQKDFEKPVKNVRNALSQPQVLKMPNLGSHTCSWKEGERWLYMIKMSSVAEVGCERIGTRVPSIEQQGEARVPSMDGARRKANKSLTHRLSSRTKWERNRETAGSKSKPRYCGQLNCKRKQNVHLSLIECDLRNNEIWQWTLKYIHVNEWMDYISFHRKQD